MVCSSESLHSFDPPLSLALIALNEDIKEWCLSLAGISYRLPSDTHNQTLSPTSVNVQPIGSTENLSASGISLYLPVISDCNLY